MTFRSARVLSRLLRKPLGVWPYRTVTGVSSNAVKEEFNASLLNNFNQDIKNGGAVPVFRRALLFSNRVALQDDFGIYTYAGLYQAASVLTSEISDQIGGKTGRTIAYMCNNDASHVIVQWAIWMSGNIAVPLTPLHPPDMLKYFLTDSTANLVICTQDYEKILRPITEEVTVPLLLTGKDKEITAQLYQDTVEKPKSEDALLDVGKSNEWYGKNDALIIYTSGTTSKPKGVVWTHAMLQTQISALHTAWSYSCNDVVLHTLPLHHIHGQLNSMLASLAAGARLRMLSSFVSHTVWSRLLGMGEREAEARVCVYHGVPAMFARLAADHARMFTDPRARQHVRATLHARMRLMCAGSAPLPATLFNQWEEISGMRLLERFGMSEVGMALSNPYRPVEARTVGSVGLPLPGVSARIVAVKENSDVLEPLVTVETPNPETQINLDRLSQSSSKGKFVDADEWKWQPPTITKHKEVDGDVLQGELLIKGPAVFTRYLNRPKEQLAKDFTPDGWFRTGDTASFSDGIFRILGRTSVDIIKTSGYKVSALQVESAILEHPNVADAAVLGIENSQYGEIVSCVVVTKDDSPLTLKDLKVELGKKLAPYQLPRSLLVIKEMPRNTMGKLDKKEIRKLYAKDLTLQK